MPVPVLAQDLVYARQPSIYVAWHESWITISICTRSSQAVCYKTGITYKRIVKEPWYTSTPVLMWLFIGSFTQISPRSGDCVCITVTENCIPFWNSLILLLNLSRQFIIWLVMCAESADHQENELCLFFGLAWSRLALCCGKPKRHLPFYWCHTIDLQAQQISKMSFEGC